MKIGDLVEQQGKRWKVTKHFRSRRMCELRAWDGSTQEVPDDHDESVLCHPPTDWPFVPLSVRPSSGPIVRVAREGSDLVPLVDWVPSAFLRAGGSIFFNPDLRLRPSEVLVAVFQRGDTVRINITRAFGTVQRRRVKANPQPPRRRSAFERIMGEDLFGDD